MNKLIIGGIVGGVVLVSTCIGMVVKSKKKEVAVQKAISAMEVVVNRKLRTLVTLTQWNNVDNQTKTSLVMDSIRKELSEAIDGMDSISQKTVRDEVLEYVSLTVEK